jgi:hypothetical protein
MKNTLLFTMLTLAFFSFSQKVERQKKLRECEKSIYEVFKNITKTDQQYVVLHYTPQEVKNFYLETNLKVIKLYIDKGLLTEDSLNVYSRKLYKSIRKGIHLTCLHTIKRYPDLFFNEEFISYIENKINQNLFDKRLLKGCLDYYYTLTNWYKFHPESKEYELVKRFDHQYDDLFYEALRRWGIEESTLNHDAITFIGH